MTEKDSNEYRKKILLVEDEPITAQLHSQMLLKAGFEILWVNSGEMAILEFEKDNNFHLVLMDIDLGLGIDGTQTAKIILEKKDIPLIFLSSHTERAMVEKTESITSYGYIVKNSGASVILAAIRMAFRLFSTREKEQELYRLNLDNEKKLRRIFNTMSEGIALNEIIFDSQGVMVDYKVLEVNDAFYKTADYRPGEVIGHCASELYGMSQDTMIHFWHNHKDKKEVQHFEMESPITKKYFIISTSPFFDNMFVTSFFDITFLKKAEEKLNQTLEEKIRLNHEILHRVKNSFFGISNLILLAKTISTNEETITILTDLATRIVASSEIYQLLYSSNNEKIIQGNLYLHRIVSSFKLIYPNINFYIKSDSFEIAYEKAATIGNIVTELFTNSAKHAFEKISSPSIWLDVQLKKSLLQIQVKDNGIGITGAINLDSLKSLGLKLVQSLVKQINGTIEFKNENGAVFFLVIPLEEFKQIIN